MSTGFTPSGYRPNPPWTGYDSPRRRASLYAPPPGGGLPGRRSWFRRFGPGIALLLVALLAGCAGYVGVTLRDVPDPGQIPELGHSIVVYDRKGRQIEQRNSQGQYYQVLSLAEMGDLNKWATLAAEDRDFYSHPAIDLSSTARAAGADLFGSGHLQGGSTITQQLVKISVLTPQRSIFRKVQEATIAFGVENNYTKDKILEMYLNRVSYGHNAYGIGAAAKVYFSKDAKALTAGQAAFLAGLINGPSYYDPRIHFDRAKERQQYVLDGMVKTGKLSQADADKAAQEDIKSELKFDQSLTTSKAPHFVDWVLEQLERIVGKDPAHQAGFKIYTTLDLDIQDLANRSVQQGVANASLKREGVNNADLLAAKPDTGEILAWVGSANYYDRGINGAFDVVAEGARQPGSSFKPYVFETALKNHTITLATTLHDKPTDFGVGAGIWPHDFDDRFLGNISARDSLLMSRNVPAVETAKMVGIDQVIKQANSQGVQPQTPLQPFLSTAIGGSDITMVQNVQGYQTFANQGTMVPLFGISKIIDVQTGDEIPVSHQSGSQVMTPAESYLITDVLKGYNSFWHLGWKRQMAGKSGTTGGNSTGKHRDAWMMAYNPNIVVGAWAGHSLSGADGAGSGNDSISAFGTEVGQYILAPFINGLPNNMSDWYKRPDGIVTGSGCPGGDHPGGSELFLAGTQNGVNCPTPSPTPTPIPTPSGTPTPAPGPSIVPSPSASPSPRPSP